MKIIRLIRGEGVATDSKGRSVARSVGGSLLGLLCLVLVLRSVQLGHLERDLMSLEFPWILAALIAFGMEYVCRTERWRRMLAHENPGVRWIDCAGPLLASYAANSVLPLRAGDILRTFWFQDLLGVTPGVVVATLLVERLLDILVLISVGGIVFVYFGLGMFGSRGSEVSLLVTSALLILSVLVFPRPLEALCLLAARLLQFLAPKVAERVMPEIQKCLRAFRIIASRRELLYLFMLSLAAWICEGYVFLSVARALPSLIEPNGSWIALPLGALATLIPGAPGYVGTFEYAVVMVMTKLGNTPTDAAAYALLLHAVLVLPTVLFGGSFLVLRHVRSRSAL